MAVKRVANEGGTPLVVARNEKVLGVIYLKDIVKEGVKEKFEDLRKIGIKTIMITGDNPMTAAAIAAEAGVDDFVAEATPETKLALIKKLQAEGHLVAMNSGTQAAKEAGNMVDLDSSPTKLIDVVRIGKQLLMTRRRVDDVLYRQRYCKIFRYHSRTVCRDLSGACGTQFHAPDQPDDGNPLFRHIQCTHYCRIDSPFAQRCQVQGTAGRKNAEKTIFSFTDSAALSLRLYSLNCSICC